MPAKYVLALARIHQLQNQFGFVVAVHIPGSPIVAPNSPDVFFSRHPPLAVAPLLLRRHQSCRPRSPRP